MRMKLTDAALKKYKPKTARDEIFDRDVKGFGVRVTASTKSFFFVRRVRGEKVRFSLGTYPPDGADPSSAGFTSLADARRQAFDIIGKIGKGVDPREEYAVRKQAQAGQELDTFANVAKRFIAQYAEGKKTPLSKRTIEGYKWALQGELTTKWAPRPITEIVDRDVIKIIDKLEAQKHFASARLFRAYLSKFFNWCIGKRLIRENPTRGLSLASAPADFQRDRVLPISELQAVLKAADGLVKATVTKEGKAITTGEAQRALVRLLILAGQRRGETSLTKWSELALEGEKPTWKIPAENTKNGLAHEVALSPEAIEVLSRLPRNGEYVFTTDGKTPISGFSKIKATLDEKLSEVNLQPWRLHDLRRSVSTGLGELGFAPHVVEMVLNHVSGEKAGVSGLYNRSRYEADCRRALAAWAKAVTATGVGGNVVELRATAST